jgi:hypothetical protein
VNVGRTLFSQVMEFVPWTSFDRIVARYGGNVRVRRLTAATQRPTLQQKQARRAPLLWRRLPCVVEPHHRRRAQVVECGVEVGAEQ